MPHGIKLKGLNNSLGVSSFAPTLVFRGKAALVAGSGFYPSSAPGFDTTATFYAPPTSYGVSTGQNGVAGSSRAYIVENVISWGGGTCGGRTSPILVATGTISKTIGTFNYSIVCPTKPTIYCYSSTPTTKASVQSIAQTGTSGGVPVWYIKVAIGFALGTPEATFLSHVQLYCFSEVVAADFTSSFGIRTFDGNSNPTFCSDKKVLRIKDYVTLTASSNPANIVDMIYTRSFCPTPETSTFLLAKPTFMNIDFARYEWMQFVLATYTPFGNQCGYHHQYRYFIRNSIVTSGINVNAANNDLDFGLHVVQNRFEFKYLGYGFGIGSPGPAPSYIETKREIFPVTIPIIDGADYD